MPHRVSPTECIRSHIDELFASGKQLPHSRNGHREVTVKTTAGPVQLARPKLRGTTEAFASRLFGSHVTKTNALESLVIASFVRGLSVRDVEAALAEAFGDQAAISKSTVSAICGQIKDEYQNWARRRLDGITLDYLFLDASFFRMHPGSPAEPVLAAWGITTGGKPACPRSSAWPRAAASLPMPGTTSSPISRTAPAHPRPLVPAPQLPGVPVQAAQRGHQVLGGAAPAAGVAAGHHVSLDIRHQLPDLRRGNLVQPPLAPMADDTVPVRAVRPASPAGDRRGNHRDVLGEGRDRRPVLRGGHQVVRGQAHLPEHQQRGVDDGLLGCGRVPGQVRGCHGCPPVRYGNVPWARRA
jgi:Transposase, Mutator family